MTAKQSQEQPITITSAKLPSTTTLSEERLAELKELYSKATPGPWRLCEPQEHPWRIGPIEAERQDTVTIVNDSGYGIMCFPSEIGSGHTRDFELAIALHNAFPSLLHAAEQMAKVVEANNKLRWALESQPCTCLDGDPCVRCVGLSEWKVDLPPTPEKGGAA